VNVASFSVQVRVLSSKRESDGPPVRDRRLSKVACGGWRPLLRVMAHNVGLRDALMGRCPKLPGGGSRVVDAEESESAGSD